MLEGAKVAISNIWESIKFLFGWTPLGLIIENWEPLKAWFQGLWDDILAGAKKAFDWIADQLGWAGDALEAAARWFGIGDEEEGATPDRPGRALEKANRSPDQGPGTGEEAGPRPPEARQPDAPGPEISVEGRCTKNISYTNYITINQQPGQSAQEVVQEIDRQQRAKDEMHDPSAAYGCP